jgi:hypothetical protein
MFKTTVDLTLSVVEAEAETLLGSYPYYPYQKAFSTPTLRQKLIAYVLCRLPHLYSVIEDAVTQAQGAIEEPLHCPPEQRQQVETLLHRGIQSLVNDLLNENASALAHQLHWGSLESVEWSQGLVNR